MPNGPVRKRARPLAAASVVDTARVKARASVRPGLAAVWALLAAGTSLFTTCASAQQAVSGATAREHPAAGLAAARRLCALRRPLHDGRGQSQVGAADSAARAAGPSPLALTLELPARVRAGERVPIVLNLANVGAVPVRVITGLPTASYDVVVVAAAGDGSAIWQRRRGEVTPLIGSMGPPMPPGASAAFTTVWDQRANAVRDFLPVSGDAVRPGTYYVRGVFPQASTSAGRGVSWSGCLLTEAARLVITE